MGEAERDKVSCRISLFSFLLASAHHLRPSQLSSLERYAGVKVVSSEDEDSSGLGLYATQSLKPSDVVIQVPTKLTLSVKSPVDYNTAMEKALFSSNPKVCRNAPWWAALSIQLNYFDKVNPINQRAGGVGGGGDNGVSIKAWMDSLPRMYDTPIFQ